MKSGTDSVDVYLCPKSFFDDMGMSFSNPEGQLCRISAVPVRRKER